MDTRVVIPQLRTLTAAATRRALLAIVSGGLLLPYLPGMGSAASEARQRGKHHRKRRPKQKRKQRNTGAQVPPPPSLPVPVARVDAKCVGSGDFDFGGIENGRLAQTFTAIASGALVRAELTVAKNEDALDEWILRLSPVDDAGVPSNRVLAETTIPDASVPIGRATVTFAFAKPFSVVAGTTYALVLTRGEFFSWTVRNGILCPGLSFTSSTQTGPFFVADNQFIFTTFVAS